jgi:hypothetical protein
MPHSIARFRRLQKICRHILRQLMFLRPTPYVVKIPTPVHGIEVDKGLQLLSWWPIPYLSEDPNISGAHELLTEDVQAVGWHSISVIKPP